MGLLEDPILWFFMICVVLPIMFIYWTIRRRSQYPVIAYVRYQIGESLGTQQGKTRGYTDRLGQFHLKNKNGEIQLVPIWKFMSNGKMVMNMSNAVVDEIEVPRYAEWIPIKKRIQIASVQAIAGEKGEEFYAMNYDLKLGSFKPILPSDRALAIHHMITANEERNTQKKFFEKYGMAIVIGGIGVIIAGMLLFTALKLGDVASAMNADTATLASAIQHIENTSNVSRQVMPSLPGLPPIVPS